MTNRDAKWTPGKSPDVKAHREHTRHDEGTPTERPAPTTVPRAKTKNGRCRCPGCGKWWTGLAWGDACPKCGIVRMAEGGWWPFENPLIDNEELLRDGPEQGSLIDESAHP